MLTEPYGYYFTLRYSGFCKLNEYFLYFGSLTSQITETIIQVGDSLYSLLSPSCASKKPFGVEFQGAIPARCCNPYSQPHIHLMNLRILTIITVFSVLLLAYPVWRIGQWLELSLITNLLITTPVFLSQFIARVALRHSKSRVQSFIKRLADLFLGFAPILLIQVVVAEVVLALSGIPSANAAIFILISSMLIGAAGMFIARFPRVVVISLKSDKVFRMQRFVQISDVHIGSRTSRFLEQIMNTIVDLDPDFLCITGDLIDQSGITIEQLKPLLKLDRPIYYCTGNHE